MNSPKTSKTCLLALGAFIVSSVVAWSEAAFPSSFDFGTDPGKVTASSAGFTVVSEGDTPPQDMANGLLLGNGEGFENVYFLQQFASLGGSNTTNFTLKMNTSIYQDSSGNNRRFGVQLFSLGDADSGISAQINRDGNSDLNLRLRNGVNGDDIATPVDFRSVNFNPGDEFSFTISGVYTGGNDLELSYTLSDGINTMTLTTIIDYTQYPGTLFGGSGRLRSNFTVEFESFSVIP